MVRPDFKSGWGCQQPRVGSTPILFRHDMDDALNVTFPTDRLYAAEQDMWVLLEGDGRVRVGATHWVAAHGQFMYFSPRPVGTTVERDRSMGVMETAKTLVSIHAPISGRIVEVNEAVVGDVAPIERDPYGEGWMFRLEPSNLEAERPLLLDAGSYVRWLEPRAQEKAQQRPIEGFDTDFTIDPNRGY